MFSLPSATSERNSISLYKLLGGERNGEDITMQALQNLLCEHKHEAS